MNPAWRYARTACVPSPRRKLAAVVATPILFLASFALLTLTMAPLLFLFWLMQPATRVNPGVSAYTPPPGARAEPIAHMVKSRDPPTELSSATNFAQDYARAELVEDAQLHESKGSSKRAARLANRKRSPYRRQYEQSARTYAQEWDNRWQAPYR